MEELGGVLRSEIRRNWIIKKGWYSQDCCDPTEKSHPTRKDLNLKVEEDCGCKIGSRFKMSGKVESRVINIRMIRVNSTSTMIIVEQ